MRRCDSDQRSSHLVRVRGRAGARVRVGVELGSGLGLGLEAHLVERLVCVRRLRFDAVPIRRREGGAAHLVRVRG